MLKWNTKSKQMGYISNQMGHILCKSKSNGIHYYTCSNTQYIKIHTQTNDYNYNKIDYYVSFYCD